MIDSIIQFFEELNIGEVIESIRETIVNLQPGATSTRYILIGAGMILLGIAIVIIAIITGRIKSFRKKRKNKNDQKLPQSSRNNETKQEKASTAATEIELIDENATELLDMKETELLKSEETELLAENKKELLVDDETELLSDNGTELLHEDQTELLVDDETELLVEPDTDTVHTCSKCNAENDLGSNFCEKCGEKLSRQK